MPNPNQIERIAAAMHAIRPEWRTNSLVTFLTTHHADRPYADLAVAAMAVACDTRTQTPQLLNQHGPWWKAAQAASLEPTPTIGPGSEPRCDTHPQELARACRCCAADEKAAS